ncbi:MAG TPA: hypothetical protein PK082_03715 [Phycisphaerae bacterium]|nr:hypothetical protein [Phycisphaerae bacterium]
MDADKASAELTVIRQLMERPLRYSTMSGVSGILAGLAALAGVLADWLISQAFEPAQAVFINALVWAGVFVAAFAAVTTLTRLREKRRGMPFWSSVKKRILLTILPPFVAGVGLTAVIVMRWYYGIGPNEWGLIPAVWMAFYGVALWQVGDFSPIELRLLGAAFVLSALPAAMFQFTLPGLPAGTAPYWTLGVTFGGYHIVYGVAVWARHGG